MGINHIKVADVTLNVALTAGLAILEERAKGLKNRTKADATPVTDADECAEKIILDALNSAFPQINVIGEEACASNSQPQLDCDTFFLVDALDGTRGFIDGSDEFTVNIALVENGQPSVGVIFAPAIGAAYVGRPDHCVKHTITSAGSIGKSKAIECRKEREKPTVLASRSHRDAETEAYFASNNYTNIKRIGSSLKFGILAEGKADLYPRFGRTMEWDIAAGHAIVLAAGGNLIQFDGRQFQYGKVDQPHDSDFANGSFIAFGKPK